MSNHSDIKKVTRESAVQRPLDERAIGKYLEQENLFSAKKQKQKQTNKKKNKELERFAVEPVSRVSKH